ncbi:MAG: hypothetical protein K0R41_3933 [Geminicoccaceae bacterium]|jgi:hypothetical protein|nr:hypothetical protein [Geminicoccaceae bacterium]
MRERGHATIGDALIFMTKVSALCLGLFIGAWIWVIAAQNQESQALATERAKVAEQQVTIASLGSKLNMCLELAGGPWTDYQGVPPGFVIDKQPRQ